MIFNDLQIYENLFTAELEDLNHITKKKGNYYVSEGGAEKIMDIHKRHI